MRISARNQLKGTVVRIKVQGLMAEVAVKVGSQEIVSTITAGSAKALALKKGDAVVAIIKASEVILGK